MTIYTLAINTAAWIFMFIVAVVTYTGLLDPSEGTAWDKFQAVMLISLFMILNGLMLMIEMKKS